MGFGKGHHLHLIDGSAFIFRAYHALPPLTRNSDGLPDGRGVQGFATCCSAMSKATLALMRPPTWPSSLTKAAIRFAMIMYDQYKANRDAMPEDLRPQMPLTRRCDRARSTSPVDEVAGYEADDIIATLARSGARGRWTAAPLFPAQTRTLMQLVGGGVDMFDAMKNRHIDRDGVFEKFGVFPDRVVDVQALAGDSRG